MNGNDIVRVIESVLAERGIKKGEFYKSVGITATAMYGWRNGAMPKPETLAAIENYLGIDFADYYKPGEDEEILQWVREDYSHRALYEAVKGLSRADMLAAASFVEKLKSGET